MATAAREFQVMVKPAGAVCDLDCTYCYYLEKKALYPKGESLRMADDLLEHYIIQHIEAYPKDVIFFLWHGGEPTILGLDYFRRIAPDHQGVKHQPLLYRFARRGTRTHLPTNCPPDCATRCTMSCTSFRKARPQTVQIAVVRKRLASRPCRFISSWARPMRSAKRSYAPG